MADVSLSQNSKKSNLETETNINKEDEDLDSVDGFRKYLKRQIKGLLCSGNSTSIDPELSKDFTENKPRRGLSKKDTSPTKETSMASDLEGDEYNFSYPKRGLSIIINNEDFSRSKEFGDRPGSSYDASSLYNSFKALGFDVLLYHDLSVWKMVEVMRSAINDYDHTQADCFACSILTHGDQTWSEKEWDRMGTTVRLDLLFGTDGKALTTKAVVEMFNDNNCPSLKDKPRFFFLQACRGDKYDDGQDILVQKKQTTTYKGRIGEGDWTDSSSNSDQIDNKINSSEANAIDFLSFDMNLVNSTKDSSPTKTTDNLLAQRQVSLSSSVDPPEYEVRRIDAVDAKGGGDDEKVDEENALGNGEPGKAGSQESDKTDAFWHSVSNIPVSPAPLYQDCLIMYATPPGHFAWRRKTGAWFIQCLCRLFDSNVLEHVSLIRGLSYVCGKVAREYQSENASNPGMHHKKEVPVIESMLIKDVFMKRKLNSTAAPRYK